MRRTLCIVSLILLATASLGCGEPEPYTGKFELGDRLVFGRGAQISALQGFNPDATPRFERAPTLNEVMAVIEITIHGSGDGAVKVITAEAPGGGRQAYKEDVIRSWAAHRHVTHIKCEEWEAREKARQEVTTLLAGDEVSENGS